jgi:hypothetical protein
MNNNYRINAKLMKLLILLGFLVSLNLKIFSQESDPISDAVNKEKNELEGIKLYPNELQELDHINKKYEISDKEKELRLKRESGQKLKLLDKYRIGKANRKDYLRAKKIKKFNSKVILLRQNEETKKRMIENEKRINKRDKKIKRKQRRKNFLNLFR